MQEKRVNDLSSEQVIKMTNLYGLNIKWAKNKVSCIPDDRREKS